MERCNTDHLMKVYTARTQHSLPKYDSTHSVKHPMVGKTITDKATGITYHVEKAVKHWWWGWYTALLIQHNGSHVLVTWDILGTGPVGLESQKERFEVD